MCLQTWTDLHDDDDDDARIIVSGGPVCARVSCAFAPPHHSELCSSTTQCYVLFPTYYIHVYKMSRALHLSSGLICVRRAHVHLCGPARSQPRALCVRLLLSHSLPSRDAPSSLHDLYGCWVHSTLLYTDTANNKRARMQNKPTLKMSPSLLSPLPLLTHA